MQIDKLLAICQTSSSPHSEIISTSYLSLSTQFLVLRFGLFNHAHDLLVDLLGQLVLLGLDLLQTLHALGDIARGEIEVTAGHSEEVLLLGNPWVLLSERCERFGCILEVFLPRLELVLKFTRLEAGSLRALEGLFLLSLESLDLFRALVQLLLLLRQGGSRLIV